MITIGRFLKEGRIKKKYSKEKLGEITKIKIDFIDAIEQEIWHKLPERPVVAGFIKNISTTLGINQKQAIALFRRDYPPSILKINPKPDVTNKLLLSPRFTFIIATIMVVVAISTYLLFQYISFMKPPQVEIFAPRENQEITLNKVIVEGSTDPEASVSVNNQPTIVGKDGKFTVEIEIFGGTEEIIVSAKSRSGKESVISRKINVDLKSD